MMLLISFLTQFLINILKNASLNLKSYCYYYYASLCFFNWQMYSSQFFLRIPSRSVEMEASLSGTALKSALLSTLSWNDLEEIGLHENPLWNDDVSERREPRKPKR